MTSWNWNLALSPLCLLVGISCAKFVIAERVPVPVAVAPQRTSAAQVPAAVATPERIIKLSVARIEPESWWDSCMFLKVNDGEEASIGCGKEKEQKGKIIELPAKKDFCNKISIRMQVTTGCPATHTCETKSWNRTTSIAEDKLFFKFFEGVKMLPLDPDIQAETEMKAAVEKSQKEAIEYAKTAANTWIRIWFEDQTKENYDLWKKDKTKWFDAGIDYNDYAIDLKGENVDFTIEGSDVTCASN